MFLFESSEKRNIYKPFVTQLFMTIEKKIREKIPEGFVNIATHDGTFHADEVFAFAAIPCDKNIIRTRDTEKIREADVRIDVGGEYDHESLSYDHHQKGGAGVRENGVPYASFGLVWKHLGEDYCSFRCADENVERVAKLVDEELVQKIDAVDTGYSSYNDEGPYPLHYGISALNPMPWSESSEALNQKSSDDAFKGAVDFAGKILSGVTSRCEEAIGAEDVVKRAVQNAESDNYLVLEMFCPWQKAVIDEGTSHKYVIFENRQGNSMVSAIPEKAGERGAYRQALPNEWRGLSGVEFQKVTGIEDAVFCHPAGFIAGAKTPEGAKSLAELASNYSSQKRE